MAYAKTLSFGVITAGLSLILLQQTAAQPADPISNAPRSIATSRVLVEFPVKTFLDNINVDPSGDLIVTSREEGKLYRVTPTGAHKIFAIVDGKPTGLVRRPNGDYLVIGSSGDRGAIFIIDKQRLSRVVKQVKDSKLLSGIAPLSDDSYLITDPYRGVIWLFNAKTRDLSVWLDDERLKRGDDKQEIPGANGIKVANNTVYVSNTEKQQILSVPLDDNKKPKSVDVLKTGVTIDDFVVDSDGTVYGAAQMFNQLVKISANGDVTVIGEALQGFTGSTAVAWGADSDEGRTLYVTTNGGMLTPPQTGVEPGRIVAVTLAK